MNNYYITGDIDNGTFRRFAKFVDSYYCANNDDIIQLIICSDGGCSESSLALFDLIKNNPITINTVAFGLVASAAAIVFAAGKHRTIMPNAWVMVHEETPGPEAFADLNVSQIDKLNKHYRRMEDQASEILATVTKTSVDKWKELHKNETYLSAEECLELGLADEIYGRINDTTIQRKKEVV